MEQYYLITWTTYGTWLPGDKRGFRTYHGDNYIPPPERYSDNDEPIYDYNEYVKLVKYANNVSGDAVKLTSEQVQIAANNIIEVCERYATQAVLAINATHAHLFVKLSDGVSIGNFCGTMKSKSSRALGEYGLRGKVWARRYHARKIDASGTDRVRKYVLSHEKQGALVMRMEK